MRCRSYRSLVLLFLGCLIAPMPLRAELPDDWAFQPMQPQRIPEVKQRDAVRQPIDAFLLAKLEAKGLGFAPEADRVTLIRRVTYDLTGLPPTPEEVAAFQADTAPDAYERLVDRLLASPRYGERAALYWLDLVRFAETDGFNADDPRPLAWRYRDYTIRAFNTDKPYDRFIREQLAGDELYPDDADALIATGMHRHYPDEYNAVNLEQRRQEILTDITDTTSSAFLGLTVGCARCHDHKFDPIAQRDYFRLQAFFAGWWPTETPLLDRQKKSEYETKLRAWEQQTAELRAKIAAIEEPYQSKEMAKSRSRFPDEYAAMVDIPFEKRDPLQKQIAAMMEKQVNAAMTRDFSKSMKEPERQEWERLKAELAKFPRPAEPPKAMVFTDLGRVAPTTYFLRRGDWKKPSKEIQPGFLSAIDDVEAEVVPTEQTTGRRTALANWITKPDNPLTARVFVNRVWQQHFGRGIVETPNDLGAQGEKPTHPELLDWLAQEFVRTGWGVKSLHRMMVTSTAYRQVSTAGPYNTIDPDNRLWSRMIRRRLDGEALRDAVLSVNGSLDVTMGGPGVFPEIPAEMKSPRWTVSASASERSRRSIYVYVKRNLRYPLFSLFDSPDRVETCARRFVSTTAPQALTLLNDSLMLGQANTFAERITREVGDKPDAVIERAYQLALSRQPHSAERLRARTFLQQYSIADFCHAVLNLNEFIYVD